MFKLLLPFLLSFLKEVFNPKEITKNATILERVLILVTIAMIVLTSFVVENILLIHGQKVELLKTSTTLTAEVRTLKQELVTMSTAALNCPSLNQCTPANTYHIAPTVRKPSPKVVNMSPVTTAIRRRMVLAINGG